MKSAGLADRRARPQRALVEGIGWVLDWLETFPGTAGTTGGSRPARTPTGLVDPEASRSGPSDRTQRSRAIAVSGIRDPDRGPGDPAGLPVLLPLKTAIGYRQILAQQDPTCGNASKTAWTGGT